ncbi:unnamed protein product [Schistocephalus solidus]|uniref:C2H2-type domain-containing protein n=1 Tax=Schistocephalus solidus TaxID=70667 RepID=A0A183SZ03_SCHSO|nr:unnamed protein product [Schistocephalus solidus]
MTTPTTDNNFIDAPPPMITDTILPPPPPAPITVMNTTYDRTLTSHMKLVGTCKYIAQRLANWCLEHQNTAENAASNAFTVPAHLLTAWGCLFTCASTKAKSIVMPTHITRLTHPPTLPAVLPGARLTVPAAKPSQTQHLSTYPLLVGIAHAHHASAWSVTFHSIAQRLVNQFQEHKYTRPTRLNCPHCPRIFTRRIGLYVRMRPHGNLR